MSSVIKAENISKQYRLGDIGTGSLSHDINRFWYKVRGKDDPYLKIGEVNDRTSKGNSEYIWSLKDVNFDIQQGDAVGIMGRNGAGKSTLLKILSRVTAPTTGSIKVKGRIASLLEVGTGFHPDLSGRDNIFLNGAILGMRKQEIKKHFDAIVDFAGVERYIDTPVKRYSSGMYVRLAFAVAAHLESEILIVDEVLAVGDAEFQKKCIGKMNDVNKGEGRTVLFVSHNMGSIAQLCDKAILLKYGEVELNGNISTVVDHYVNSQNKGKDTVYIPKEEHIKDKSIYISSAYLSDATSDNAKGDFSVFENIKINIRLVIKQYSPGLKISVTLQNKNGDYVSTFVEDLDKTSKPGEYLTSIILDKELIAPNNYYIRFALFVFNGSVFDLIEMVCPFKIHDTGTSLSSAEGFDYGSFLMKYKIENFEKIS